MYMGMGKQQGGSRLTRTMMNLITYLDASHNVIRSVYVDQQLDRPIICVFLKPALGD